MPPRIIRSGLARPAATSRKCINSATLGASSAPIKDGLRQTVAVGHCSTHMALFVMLPDRHCPADARASKGSLRRFNSSTILPALSTTIRSAIVISSSRSGEMTITARHVRPPRSGHYERTRIAAISKPLRRAMSDNHCRIPVELPAKQQFLLIASRTGCWRVGPAMVGAHRNGCKLQLRSAFPRARAPQPGAAKRDAPNRRRRLALVATLSAGTMPAARSSGM